jgi:hypothetical protein
MKRTFALMATVGFALAVSAAAQNTMPQPGPQGTTQNQNAPQMQMNPAQPSQAPSAGTTAVTPTPATSTPAANAPATTPKSDDANANTTPAPTGKTTGDSANTSTAAPTGKSDAPQPNAPKTPHTEMVGTPSTGPQSADPLLQPPPMPPNKSTLVGGIAKKVDGIRNRVVIAPFGSSKTVAVQFDERTHIYRDSHETTILGIKKGDRVYADTMLIGPKVFARNLRVITSMGPAEASGQVVAYDPKSQNVRIVDKLTNTPVEFRIGKDTELRSKNGQATADDIRPGSLVSVIFAPGQKGGEARQISVLAVPGSSYIFAGRITNLDLHAGIIDVDNQSDGKNYELHFPPAMENSRELHIGAQVAANASFDGHTYRTQQVTVTPDQTQNAEK